jgi:hypothetical protein
VSDDGLPFGTIDSSWSLMSGPGTALFRVSNGTTYAQFSDVGLYTLRLSANDGRLASFDDVAINVLSNTPGPVVQVVAPLDAAAITAPTVVTGIVQSALLQSWALEYRLKPADVLIENGIETPETAWLTLASGTSEVNSTALATFDPTLLLNGIYELRLTASDQIDRHVTTDPITVLVDKAMKIGNFTVSFRDVRIPLAGIPIEVVRTYDSRDKRVGDFGVGWHLDLNNIRIQKNRNLGVNWQEDSSGGFFPTYSLGSRSDRIVTITFPGDKVYKFQAKSSPEDQFGVPITAASITYEPLRETLGSLVSLGTDGDDVLVAGATPGIVDLFDYHGDTYNPSLFRFTMAEGDEFVLDEKDGLKSMRDRNGNTLTVTTNGIFHSSGASITFVRDDSGRITNIVDTAGHVLTYQYDGAGNL